MRFVGYPRRSSTGDIFILAKPKLSIDVKTSVFAKPHSPFTKKAASVAIIQNSMLSSTLSNNFLVTKSHGYWANL